MIHASAIRRFGLSCLAAFILFASGCGGPDEAALQAQRERQMRLQLEEANAFLNEGATDEAILLLEVARSEYPGQPDILEALAFAYLAADQHDLAADLFAEVYQLDPSRTGITVFAARAYSESGESDSSIEHYTIYLEHHPEDSQMWRDKAALLIEQNRRRPALDALLEALRHEEGDPSAADCLQISKLFLSLGNPSQAQSWLERAEELPLETDQRVELKLQQFDLALRNQEWQQAAAIMQALDQDYPTQFQASPLYGNRGPLEEWIARQMRVQDLRITPDTPAEGEQAGQADESDPGATIAVADEPEAATAVADSPETVDDTAASSGSEPAADESVVFSKIPDDPPEVPQQEPETQDAASGIPAFALVNADEPLPIPVESPPVRQGLIGQADLARDSGDYNRALSLYLQAAGQDDQSATPWVEISRIYNIRGLSEDAELTALEAMRRDPQDPALMLNYLEIIQTSANDARRLRELNAARARFPDDPDITYAVARGFERPDNRPRNAIFLYREFLDQAPTDHPKRDDAEAALQRLR